MTISLLIRPHWHGGYAEQILATAAKVGIEHQRSGSPMSVTRFDTVVKLILGGGYTYVYLSFLTQYISSAVEIDRLLFFKG
jgi:hypothetical protein